MRADIECLEGCMNAVESLDGCEVIMEVLQLERGSEVVVASKVSLFGSMSKKDLFLATAVEDDIPQL